MGTKLVSTWVIKKLFLLGIDILDLFLKIKISLINANDNYAYASAANENYAYDAVAAA